MSKKLSLLSVLIVVVTLGFLSGLLSFHGLCGWKAVGLNPYKGKEWPCKCFGIKQGIGNSYEEVTVCTGINLSYNILNNFIKSNSQVPVYSGERLYLLEVTSVTGPILSKQSILPNTSIDVLSTEGSLIKRGTTDIDGKVSFFLPKGDYKINPSGGYTGMQEIFLETDTSIELRLLPILN